MAYTYPAPRTGTAQDLMRVVTKAYEERLVREGVILPVKTEIQRRCLEPFARAAGIVASIVMEIMPADWGIAIHDRVFRSLAGGRSYPFDDAGAAVRGACAAAARLRAQSGCEPALLAAISHPPVLGDLAHLNFELVRHATLALRAVRSRPCRPRLVVAVDPFALDTTAIIEEGLYAGYMASFHIGLDRLALGRGHWGPVLSPQARWDRMPFRLMRTLAGGGEVGMVLSGGVPMTGLVLYGMREWARRALAFSPMRSDPKAVLGRLRVDAVFARFEGVMAEILPLPRSSWRLMEAWLMAAAAGLLPDQTAQDAARAALSCLSVPEAEGALLMKEFVRDMARETPSRRRLFRLIVGRVVRRRPLLLIPVVHGTEPLGVTTRAAWGVVWRGPGRVSVTRVGSLGAAEEMTADELAERFTGENFA